jgi:hypothetical protein
VTRKPVLLAAFAGALLLALAVYRPAQLSTALAQGPGLPEEHNPEAALGTGFTYQGQLRDSGGEPVDSTCDLTFSLWGSLSGGTQIGADSAVAGVTLADGYFTVVVNGGGEFGAEAFTGDARWLEIAVQCTGDTGATTLSPRQALNLTPYASYSMGAPWSGLTGVPNLQQRVTGTCEEGSAIRIVNANGSVMCQEIPADHWGETWTGLGTGLTLTGGDVGLSGDGTTYGVQGSTAATGGYGVYGSASATTGGPNGVRGVAASTDGSGVWGEATATSGYAYGVRGISASTSGRGVYGTADALTGEAYGVHGRTSSDAGRGVYGEATRTSGTTYGVYGRTRSPEGYGVYGWAWTTTGLNYGVYGEASSDAGYGVYGHATSDTGVTYGLYGRSESTSGYGVLGWASAASGTTWGVYGQSSSTAGYGVYGFVNASTGSSTGVFGQSNSNMGTGVYGAASSPSGTTYGVRGAASSSTGYGVYGLADRGYGIYGYASHSTGTNYGVYGKTNSTDGYGGYFYGDVHVQGTLSKTGGSFKIDHPLDPANKYLYHSFVESPDMMNIYNGVVVLDRDGSAWVTLPEWFEALNGDFRYQLTPIGAPAPDLYIAQEVVDNRFQIAGGAAGLKVSWQLTGIRHDPWAEANRIPVEEDKPAKERGTYLYPELYGQPEELGLDYLPPPDPAEAGAVGGSR